MTTSAAYSFAPSLGELLIEAYGRLKIYPASFTADHMIDARNASNYLQVQWANLGVNLWSVDLQTFTMVAGTSQYTIPASTVMILDLYINNGSSDRIVTPFSRTDYASIANKTQTGFPTSFWFDRLIAPTITFWPVPDASATYTVSYYRYRQIQDAVVAGGLAPEVPYLFLDAFAAALAHRLSRKYAPDLTAIRAAEAKEAWDIAANQGVENVPLYVTPALQGYFR